MTAEITPHRVGDEVPEVVRVDPPEPPRRTLYATVVAARDAQRRPIVPAWLRNRAEARALAVWLAKYGAHLAGYHATRIPLYVLRVVWRVPAGLAVAVTGIGGWVLDVEGAPLRRAAAQKTNTAEYLALCRQRRDRVRQRATGTAAAAGGVAVGAVLGWWLAPGWLLWLLVALAVVVLGKLGTPADRRITDVAVVNAAAPPRLSAEVVTRALRALGISAMTAKGTEITYPAPITRDGPGWRADVDLPHGVTPGMVMDKRAELASGLRRPLGCVWPEPARDQHAGRLVLWVGDRDLAKSRQPPWPLARSGRTDLFAPVPFGTDQRGRQVAVTLMFASMVVGSIPRMGKTFSLRLLLLAAALDPIAELHLFDLKGTGDLSTLAPVAHAYRAGDDVEDIEYALADMRALQAELRRRTKVIRELPRSLCPESKITRELSERRPLGLWPVVLGVDECQRWFEHPDHGKELTAIAEDLVRRGPAAGITAIFATQRPDAKSIPTGISGNAILRFCLKVMDHVANDQVLGTSAHRNGIKATVFSRKDLGIGWLSGEDDDPQITRTYYVDNPGAEAIVTRARTAREAAGTLSGHAVGEQPDPAPGGSLIDDLRVVFATITVEKVWSEDVVRALAGHRPELYAGLTPEALAALLRPLGITTGQVWGQDEDGVGRNRRGVERAAVLAAIDRGGRPPEIES